MLKLLSITEAGSILGLSRWTVTTMLKSGQLPGIILRAGRRKKVWRIREEALQTWIAAKEAETKKIVSTGRSEFRLLNPVSLPISSRVQKAVQGVYSVPVDQEDSHDMRCK
jgi:excisionase family DNA binding protein